MGGGGGDVGVGDGRGMEARGHQAGDMGHIHEQIGPHLVGDLPEGLEVDDPGIGGGAGHDHLGLMLLGQVPDLIVVDPMGHRVHAVGDDVVVEAGEVHGAAVGQVAAVVQVHAHDGVAVLAQGLVNGEVGGGAAVGLHVDIVGVEQLLGPVTGDVLHHVHAFAAAVVPLAGIALGVLVGQNGGGRRQHRFTDEVLRGDKLDISPLPVILRLYGIADLRVLLGQKINDVFYHRDRSFTHEFHCFRR